MPLCFASPERLGAKTNANLRAAFFSSARDVSNVECVSQRGPARAVSGLGQLGQQSSRREVTIACHVFDNY